MNRSQPAARRGRPRAAGAAAAAVTLTVLAASCRRAPGDDARPPLEPAPALTGATDLARGAPTAPSPWTAAALVENADPPPALSGGTLIVTRDGRTAVAADPERDAVYLVDLAARAVRRVALARGDEPGRLAEDAAGRVHVALRRGGALASIELASGALAARRAVCPAPRGVAFDHARDALHVACAGGELVTLTADPTTSPGVVRTLALPARDLRDVLVEPDGGLLVTTFRAAGMIALAPDGAVRTERAAPGPVSGLSAPHVAWRALALPEGGALVVHQRARVAEVRTVPGGYGAGACSDTSIVESTVSAFGPAGANAHAGPALTGAVLPVDLALAPDGRTAVVVAPGRAAARGPQLFVAPRGALTLTAANVGCVDAATPRLASGQAVAAAFAGPALFAVQTREPAALALFDAARGTQLGAPIALASDSRYDSGHQVFHADAGGFVACASCHPEGGDDGHVWAFAGAGLRRTQSLRVGLRGTEPFHWEGDLGTFPVLVHEVFAERMSGGELPAGYTAALFNWLDAAPRPARPSARASAAIERGRALFESTDVGCASCHGGPHRTNNATVDVGTGAAFQVPSLVGLAERAPYMHDGCARDLRERFVRTACGGGERHGHTAALAPAQLDDLLAYLEAL